MTTKELFESEKITEDWLFINLKGKDAYSNKAYRFVVSYWEKSVENLTKKQKSWLESILEDCVEKRILDRQNKGRFH